MPSKAGQQSNQIMRIHACFWSKMRCHDVVICVFCVVLLLICCYKAYNVPFSSLELIMVYSVLQPMQDAVVVVCCLVSTALMRVSRHETDGFVIGHLRIQASLLGSIKASQLSAFQLICIAQCYDDEFYILAPRLGRKPFYMVLQCNSDLTHIIWASNGSYKYQINSFREKKKYMIKETEHKSYLGIVHYSLNRTHAWIIYIVFTFQYLRDKVYFLY